MSTKAGSQNVGTVKAVSADYAVNALTDDGLILDVTASGSAVNLSLPSGMANGWSVLIHRNAASSANVVIGSPVSVTLSQADETLELRWDGSAWAKLARGVGSGFLVAANNLSDLANAATARTNLGLGDAAVCAATDFDVVGSATAVQINLNSHTTNTSNPHSVTKAQIGLSNVTNDAQVTSVTGTAPIVSSGGITPVISISAATEGAPGSMSAADKARLDGLTVLNTLYDDSEISITGATTATIQRAHVCSGTSADYTVTLPTPAAGKLIAFRMDSALTKLVTLDAGSGKTIDGAQTRVMWANETCILLGVSSTVWVKIAGKSIPMRSRMYLGSNQGSLSNGAYNDVNLNTVASGADPASMTNTTAHTITIRRAGLYRLVGNIAYGSATTWNQILCSIWANGTTNIVATELNSQSFSSGAPTFPATMQYVASAGDALNLRYYKDSSGGTPVVYNGSNATFLEVEELLSW